MLEQNEQIVGVDERLFRRAVEEIIGMVGQELIQRVGRGNQGRQRCLTLATGATGLLPCCGNCPWIPSQYSRAHPPNINSQFQRIGGDYSPYLTFSQPSLDLTTLAGQVAAAIGPDLTPLQLSPTRGGAKSSVPEGFRGVGFRRMRNLRAEILRSSLRSAAPAQKQSSAHRAPVTLGSSEPSQQEHCAASPKS